MKLHKILIIEYAIVICLSVFVSYLYKDQIYSKLRDYKLVYIPESFTELFFTDHLNLPTTISANVDQTFTFTIHNLENKDMSYSWEVFVVPDFQLTLKESSASDKTSMANGVTEASESRRAQAMGEQWTPNLRTMLEEAALPVLELATKRLIAGRVETFLNKLRGQHTTLVIRIIRG